MPAPPPPDAELTVPARSIPRMERRVLGSIYGSARPDRDFPLILDAYRRGRLPLDRLISHRLTLDEVGVGIDAVRSGDATRVVLGLGGGA
jgi:alcohol dehydrogenase